MCAADHVTRVLEKVRNEGFWNTVQQVREKLDEPMPMGCCSASVVLACGSGVGEFKPADLVASNAGNAEVVCESQHLCARVPAGVMSRRTARDRLIRLEAAHRCLWATMLQYFIAPLW